MSSEALQLFWSFGPFVVLLSVIGIYCILVTYNLLRALIGVPVGLLAFGFIWLVHELDHLLRRSGAPSRRPFRGLSA